MIDAPSPPSRWSDVKLLADDDFVCSARIDKWKVISTETTKKKQQNVPNEVECKFSANLNEAKIKHSSANFYVFAVIAECEGCKLPVWYSVNRQREAFP